MKQEYSIILPTLNEENNIQLLINEIYKELINKKINFEVIFVDDSSSDQTIEIIKKNMKLYKNIKLLIREENFDLSLSVIEGIKISKFNNIIVMDSDLQHPPSALIQMINYKKKYQLVIASRFKNKKFKFNDNQRNLYTKLGIFLSNLFLKKKLSDPLSGFFIVDKNLVTDQIKYLNNKGYKILLNILLIYRQISIFEFDFNFDERKHGSSKLNMKVKWYFIKLLLKSIFFEKFDATKK